MFPVPSSVRSLLVAAPQAKRDPQPAIERALSMEEVLILEETSSLDEARSDHPAYRVVQRSLDILVAGATLVLLSPLFAITALLIWLQDRGPVFHVETRVGLGGRHFRSPRFRTMRVDADRIQRSRWELEEQNVFTLKADPRITRCGRLLRRFGVDALPQLWCVLRGDMTLVGPRPPLVASGPGRCPPGFGR